MVRKANNVIDLTRIPCTMSAHGNSMSHSVNVCTHMRRILDKRIKYLRAFISQTNENVYEEKIKKIMIFPFARLNDC
jgi:hypothetical protein